MSTFKGFEENEEEEDVQVDLGGIAMHSVRRGKEFRGGLASAVEMRAKRKVPGELPSNWVQPLQAGVGVEHRDPKQRTVRRNNKLRLEKEYERAG